MRRVHWLLLGVITAELAVGAFFVRARLRQATPPLQDLAALDAVAAREIRERVGRCQSAEQWAELGEIYIAAGFFPEGEACLRQACALDPASAVVAFKHAFALERLGKVEEAIAGYKTAIDLNHPRRADCWYYVGKNHLRLEDEAAATAAFKHVGGLAGARFELALLDARAGRLAEADAEARRLIAEFPNAYPPVSLSYRMALAKNDQKTADALADLFARKARPLPTPQDAEVDWVFGVANRLGRSRLFREAGEEMKAGRVAKAETKLREAMDAGWSPEIADKLAEVLFIQGRKKEAADTLADAVRRSRPSFALLWRLGQANAEIGRADPRELWERAARVATGPAARGLWEDLAERYERGGEKEKANKMHARAFLAAGLEALDAGNLAGATVALNKAIGYDPRLAHAHFYLGEVARLSGQPAQARAGYERCLALDLDHGRARRGLTLMAE